MNLKDTAPAIARARGGQPGNQNARKKPLPGLLTPVISNPSPETVQDLYQVVMEIVSCILVNVRSEPHTEDELLRISQVISNIIVRLGKAGPNRDTRLDKIIQEVLADMGAKLPGEDDYSLDA